MRSLFIISVLRCLWVNLIVMDPEKHCLDLCFYFYFFCLLVGFVGGAKVNLGRPPRLSNVIARARTSLAKIARDGLLFR